MATANSGDMAVIPPPPPSYEAPAAPGSPEQPTRRPPLPPYARSAGSPPSVIPAASPSIDSFFTRCRLAPTARQLCWDFIHAHYPSSSGELVVHECPNQGYCSYTFCIGDSQIIQFRPRAHQLNMVLPRLAREVYGVLAPETRSLGVLLVPTEDEDEPAPLLVYSMTCMPGISLTDFRKNSPGRSASAVRSQRAILVRDFARFLSLGWMNRRPGGVDLPFKGRLGGSLRSRLEMMRERLPLRFRPDVDEVLRHLNRIEALPWVLTHGDVVPDNIMVEASGGHRGTGWWPGTLRGMLDWAESEYLPFGIGLYGAEELFGQVVPHWGGTLGGTNTSKSRFAYYPEAGDLRRLFWQELENAIPALATDRQLRATVEQARVLGVLLWHGFAFDDGDINRVVEDGRDDDEIQKLDMFLFGTDHPVMTSNADLRVATARSEKDEARRQSVKQPAVSVTVTEAGKNVPKGWLNVRQRISKIIL